jgi:hypothetical protein
MMLGSTTSAVLFTSKLIAFAQKSGNSALQAGYQPSIDHVANLIHNKTGIDEVSVKPILEQMAVQIFKTKGMVPLNNTIAGLTHVVKRPYTDIVSLSVYKLATDWAAGNRSSINQAISQFAEQIGDGKNPSTPLAQIAIQLTGGLSLTKKIDRLTMELENSTGADAPSVKEILNVLTLLIADILTKQDANNSINQIEEEVKANPTGVLAQALTQLSQEHFTGINSILQLALLGHESIPVAITSQAIRTIGGYHMDWEIYKIANETHSKLGISIEPVEKVLQQIALEIANTGGRALSYNTVNNLTRIAENPVILQSLFRLGSSEAVGNTRLVNLYVAQFSQQIDNGGKITQTLSTIVPPDGIHNACNRDLKSSVCKYYPFLFDQKPAKTGGESTVDQQVFLQQLKKQNFIITIAQTVQNSNSTSVLTKISNAYSECQNSSICSMALGIVGHAACISLLGPLCLAAEVGWNTGKFLANPSLENGVDVVCSGALHGLKQVCDVGGKFLAVKGLLPSGASTTQGPPPCSDGSQPDANGNCPSPQPPQPNLCPNGSCPSPQPPQPPLCDPVYGCQGAFVNQHYSRISFLIPTTINSMLYSKEQF